jgi:hypothetical protein
MFDNVSIVVKIRMDPPPACPRVAMGIAPLTRHRSTSVLLLKTSLALYGGEYILLEVKVLVNE